MQARYADGRSATIQDASWEASGEGIVFVVNGASHAWPYAELARADDNNGAIIIKRKPDTGERLTLDADAAAVLKAAAPLLLRPSARGVESWRVIGVVAAAAWSVAAVLLIGVPLAAGPIANAMPNAWRGQISEISWSQVNAVTATCDDADAATAILNDLADRLMQRSHLPQRGHVYVTIVRAGFPNAFAMPDDTVVVTDQLIAMAEQPDELAGVIAHEIAHIERNHVMTNVVRHIGAGVFFDIVFGTGGAGQAIAVASVNLSGLGYDRDAEAEADRRGFDYLEAANIDPGGLGRLFDRFARTQHESHSAFGTLLSNHPATAERAAAARARARPGSGPALTAAQWRIVRSACGAGAPTRQPAAEAQQAPKQPQHPAPAPPAEPADKPE
jgi:Zn-dependent protease with chaperone function